MSTLKTYRHKVTGLVQQLDPMTARGMGDRIEEVKEGAKPLTPLTKLVADSATKSPTKKEQKDG